MIKEAQLSLLGGGWISAFGYGRYGSKPLFTVADQSLKFPDLTDYLDELPSRFGRFDLYTKVAFATAVLALQDAGMLQRDEKKNIGIVLGSASGVYDNDRAFFESTLEGNGAFASPNLFSYTLPNVALGEIAVFFKFMGPTFCVGNNPAEPGTDAITVAQSLLRARQCATVLLGWVEVAQKTETILQLPRGAAMAVLSIDETANRKARVPLKRDLNFFELFEVNDG